ncbi:hypothetical protein ACPA54_29015 [Uniformispora flossi]|uniref:hypothetical protein n=1 Tax=Uniformispora flossi TaxID=3390723 RepID=UPI003C2EBC11
MKAPHEDREVPSRDPRPHAASPPETASAEPVAAASASAPRLDRRSVQRLAAGGAGNKAVARLVAQRYAPIVKPPPAHAPGFRKTQNEVAAKKRHIGTHHPAATESKSAQDAAVAPPDDKEAQGKAAQAEKMNAAKPGGFDKAAFVKAVNEAIAKQAPKNLDEADKFSGSGKAEKVKGEVDGQVGQGKEKSAKDIATTTKAAPDTSKAKDKPVTPMQPDQAPANPGAPDPAGAVPDKQPAAVTDFSEGKQDTDRQMADAEVTDDQLKKGNEPEFDDALSAKKEGEQHSAKAPTQARTAEDKQRDAAKQGAAAVGAQAVEKLTATRQQAGKAVDGGKGDTKSKDEQKRAEVTAKLQKVFDATKKDVESTLSGLDKLVDDKFDAGEKAARDAFTADHKRRMKAYKDKRYSGFTGKLKWAKDKLLGMPAEANEIFAESRKLYVAKMQGVISDVADVIGTELGKAKDRISQGRRDLKAEVDKLPADLKKFGEDAAKDFAGKFDDLDSQVDEKSQQLVTDLAQKYTDALNKIDEEIKKLQEENKGLWDKVKDAVVGVIKTIMELKDMLLGVLAKAASAVMKIIKDPIGFLKNLVSAVGDGLQRFLQNIGDHLKKGLVSWLLGVSASSGIEIPSKFDLKGIIGLIASLLGLTWENIKSRITRKGVPDQAMTAVESSVPVASALAKEGPAGAVDHIAAEVGDLKATLLEKIAAFLIPTVLIAGITWVISLFNPASAFVKAVKAIIDIVTFIVTQGAQIIEFVNTVLDAVIAIADGGGGGVPALVENALAKSIPVLIGVLAALLGVGGLADKVKKAIQSVSKPVNRAIDKIVDKIAAAGKRIWNKLKAKLKPTKDKLKAGKDKLKDKYASGKQKLKDKFGRKDKKGPGKKDRDKQDDEPQNTGKGKNDKDGKDEKDGGKKDPDVRAKVVAELESRLSGENEPGAVSPVIHGVYAKYRKAGLKELDVQPIANAPGKYRIYVTASPKLPALTARIQLKNRHLKMSFTAKDLDFANMDTPTAAAGSLRLGGVDIPLGIRRSGKTAIDPKADDWHHAEAKLIRDVLIVLRKLKSGNLPHVDPALVAKMVANQPLSGDFTIKVTRSPCEPCGEKIGGFDGLARQVAANVSVRPVVYSLAAYKGKNSTAALDGLQVMRQAGIEVREDILADMAFDKLYQQGHLATKNADSSLLIPTDAFQDLLRRSHDFAATHEKNLKEPIVKLG